jgi:FkbM family methyltransferase
LDYLVVSKTQERAVEVELVCEGRKFVFSGEESDTYFKIWRELGFYGGKRDVVPYRIALKPNSISVDIGGNIGLTAILTGALCPEGRAYFFEPDPKNFKHLKRSIEVNGFADFIAFNKAVGETSGYLKMNQMDSSTHVAAFDQKNSIEVPMISLDDWSKSFPLDRVDFLKIDVEGYERSVLRGAKETIAKFRPVTLIEFNSLTAVMVGRMLPYDLMDEIFSHFQIVDVIDLYTGLPKRLERDPFSVNSFVGENMLNGFVRDLLCYFEDSELNKVA